MTGTSKPLSVVAPEFLGEFLPASNFEPSARSEWMATLEDCTEVVVPDVDGGPSAVAAAKAASVLLSRACLQQRALQLVRPLLDADGAWQLVTLDFGVAAERAGCEFLMCMGTIPCSR